MDYQSWVDDRGYSHAAIAILWVIAAFILFQFFGGVIAIILILVKTLITSGGLGAEHLTINTSQNIELLFWGNSSGQLLFLGLATWLFCRVHVDSTNRSSFLRFQTFDNTPKMIGIAFVLILVVQPLIWFVAWLNTLIPMPHFLQSLQTQQMGPIKDYIGGKGHLGIILFNVALVPAFCEEILFRGYALRSFQKSWGPLAAMVVTGVIFGIFHLEPVNFLPLAMIGMLLAYITWSTRSIFPAMVAHFVNNALGILLVRYYPDTALASTTATTMPPIGLFILSIILSSFLVYLLATNKISPIKR